MGNERLEVMKICCLTAYHDRPQFIVDLVRTVSKNASCDHQIDHYIVDDCSKEQLPDDIYNYEHSWYRIHGYRSNECRGRIKYWQTVNDMYGLVKNKQYDYYLHLNDDHELSEGIFNVMMTDQIMVLIRDERDDNRFNGSCYQQVDGASLMPFEYLKAINFEVLPIYNPPPTSSGVWRQVSSRLQDAVPGVKFYHPSHSLVKHKGTTEELSQMNPKNRALVSLKTPTYRKKVPKSFKWIDPWTGFKSNTDKKVCIHLHEGIGNTIQAVPAIYAITSQNVDATISIHANRKDESVKAFHKKLFDKVEDIEYDEPGYQHISLFRRRWEQRCSEVEAYLELMRNAGYSAEGMKREVQDFMPIPKEKFGFSKKKYDVVLCNGGIGGSGVWLRKRYMRWWEVVKVLRERGYSVAQVGLPGERVHGTDPHFGPITDAFKLINSSRVFMSNDTGLYHYSCAISKPTVVAFTATSKEKNYDRAFHRSAKLIDLTCENGECQDSDGARSDRWLRCEGWECCFKDPQPIINAVLEILECIK